MIAWWMAACVQRIQYVKSYYIREWELKREEEKILLVKTADENKAKLTAYITKNHPYEIPEIIFLNPQEVNEAYATWLTNASQQRISKWKNTPVAAKKQASA